MNVLLVPMSSGTSVVATCSKGGGGIYKHGSVFPFIGVSGAGRGGGGNVWWPHGVKEAGGGCMTRGLLLLSQAFQKHVKR